MKTESAKRIAAAAIAVFHATRERTQAKKLRWKEIQKYLDETGEYFLYDYNCDDDGAEEIKSAFDACKQSVKALIRARSVLRREILKEVK